MRPFLSERNFSPTSTATVSSSNTGSSGVSLGGSHIVKVVANGGADAVVNDHVYAEASGVAAQSLIHDVHSLEASPLRVTVYVCPVCSGAFGAIPMVKEIGA